MYITALRTISPQSTFNDKLLEGDVALLTGIKYLSQESDYTGLISPNLLRRMGKSIRIGIGAGFPLMQLHNDIDGIILGSSEGGLEDCIKFLNQIVQYNEGTLTPTNFVQSTPNALAGSLALMSQNSCYNITHVHRGHAFENSLIDALMLFDEGKAKKLLVGNVEEISEYNFNIEMLGGQFKKEETTSEKLLTSNTAGTVCGEGSSMFILQSEATEFLAQIIDVEQATYPTESEIHILIESFLAKNNLTASDIDALLLGYNGDNRSDFWYTNVANRFFPNQAIYTYKNLVGEYPTAIAFATYMATHLLSGKDVKFVPQRKSDSPLKKILIYNHYKSVQHGLILMSA